MSCPFTSQEFELRLAQLKHSRDIIWKKNPGYCRLLDLEIYALELALAHVKQLEGALNVAASDRRADPAPGDPDRAAPARADDPHSAQPG